ncbi:hypothetical protein [Falsiroseomonas tokyonensis]|uniref:Uncharacterized protein n=1 Tax=Falsiroseomonas tokyonensis TaxID=430521 RepID=A0ABV7BX45_9PROT|nr:hypothetical protein [Falsiroseomonas tokyonensis]MBU8538755.1 hypothetical protein [Falsiroseomonas tokyonensis]
MPFNNTALVPLVNNSGFTMWLYRTTDSRADALTPGYFEPAAARLETGDIIVLIASDSVSFLPVRVGDVVAAGLVLDSAAAPFRVQVRAVQVFSVAQTATAVAMTVILGPLAAGILSNGTVEASATLAGPVTQVAFSISDAMGTTVRGPTLATVTAGSASASLPAPAPGTGYRLRVVSTGDSAVAAVSPAFSVTLPFGLLLQAGGTLLIEDGSRLLV